MIKIELSERDILLIYSALECYTAQLYLDTQKDLGTSNAGTYRDWYDVNKLNTLFFEKIRGYESGILIIKQKELKNG